MIIEIRKGDFKMGKGIKALQDETRGVWFEKLFEAIAALGEDVQRTGSNTMGFYTLDSEGNETAVKITVQVPKGSRDGDEFDPVGEAKDFEMKQAEKAAKAAEALKAKEKKIKVDEKRRAEAAERKQKKEEGRGE